MSNYRDLQVWEKAHRLTLAVYAASQSFPREELYGLTGQIRRACASIPANLAEGSGRLGKAEFRRFVQISLGSAAELDYHLLLARDLGILSPHQYQPLADTTTEVRRMLVSLYQKLTTND